MELFFDTETSGIYRFKESYESTNQPWVVQLGMILSNKDKIFAEINLILKSFGRKIEPGAIAVHGISSETADSVGVEPTVAYGLFTDMCRKASRIICHNTEFDINIMKAAFFAEGLEHTDYIFNRGKHFCTMKTTTHLCKIPGYRGSYKWPKLIELYEFLFNERFEDAHDALADVRATRRCYYELINRGFYKEPRNEQSNESPT